MRLHTLVLVLCGAGIQNLSCKVHRGNASLFECRRIPSLYSDCYVLDTLHGVKALKAFRLGFKFLRVVLRGYRFKDISS